MSGKQELKIIVVVNVGVIMITDKMEYILVPVYNVLIESQ